LRLYKPKPLRSQSPQCHFAKLSKI
jgi:hypothetical protein